MNYDARTLGTQMMDDIKKVQNRIWITERCHMNAEKRSRFLELYFHIVLALFALASIGVSMLRDAQMDGSQESILSFTSITTLCLSLLIFGFKFGETAARHRSCYLALQKLRAEQHENSTVLETKYIEILGHHPNHTPGDYMRLAVSNILQGTQDIESPPGQKVKLSLWTRLTYAIGWLIARVALLFFGFTPFIISAYGTGLLSGEVVR